MVGTVKSGSEFLEFVGRSAASAVIGGTASVIGGGKFANGAQTGAFTYAFRSGLQDAAQGGGTSPMGGFAGGVLDIVGKIWALPNTLIGLVYGGVGYVAGWANYAFGGQTLPPGISFGNNALQFTNNPLTTTAITFGNSISYGTGSQYQPNALRAGGHTLGFEEMQHTYQAQVLGPLYLPTHVLLGTAATVINSDWHGSANILETGPHELKPRPF